MGQVRLSTWQSKSVVRGDHLRVSYRPVGSAVPNLSDFTDNLRVRVGVTIDEGSSPYYRPESGTVVATLRVTRDGMLFDFLGGSVQAGGGLWVVDEVWKVSPSTGSGDSGASAGERDRHWLADFFDPNEGQSFSEEELSVVDEDTSRRVRASEGTGTLGDLFNLSGTTKLLVGLVAVAVIAWSVSSVLE